MRIVIPSLFKWRSGAGARVELHVTRFPSVSMAAGITDARVQGSFFPEHLFFTSPQIFQSSSFSIHHHTHPPSSSLLVISQYPPSAHRCLFFYSFTPVTHQRCSRRVLPEL